jgi:hypothetical protein
MNISFLLMRLSERLFAHSLIRFSEKVALFEGKSVFLQRLCHIQNEIQGIRSNRSGSTIGRLLAEKLGVIKNRTTQWKR